jgi:hypothetical protein
MGCVTLRSPGVSPHVLNCAPTVGGQAAPSLVHFVVVARTSVYCTLPVSSWLGLRSPISDCAQFPQPLPCPGNVTHSRRKVTLHVQVLPFHRSAFLRGLTSLYLWLSTELHLPWLTPLSALVNMPTAVLREGTDKKQLWKAGLAEYWHAKCALVAASRR